MSKKETDFRKRLLSTFKVEAQEHLKTITAGLVELEKHRRLIYKWKSLRLSIGVPIV